MRKLKILQFSLFFTLFFSYFSRQVLADVGKLPSGLAGCETLDIAATSDAAITFAGCDGPFGAYYSTDFGSTWKSAVGGDYANGSGRKFAVSGTNVYFLSSSPGTLFSDSIAHFVQGSPQWKKSSITSISTFNVDNSFFVYGDFSGGVFVASPQTLQTISSSSISGGPQVAQIALDGARGFAYALASLNSDRHIYRASYSSSTGALGTWTDITTASGLPSSAVMGTIGIGPDHGLYASARSGSDLDSAQVYVSSNDGLGFSTTGVTNFLNDYSFSQNGTVAIIGNSVTSDAGVSYAFLNRSSVDEPQLQNTAVLMNPINQEMALVRTGTGLARTTNLVTNSGSPTWTDVNSGLLSANVLDVSQDSQDKARVLIGLNTGVAYTENFTANTPSFTTYCPAGSCLPSRVTLDSSSKSTVYAGSNSIFKGSISNSKISWDSTALIDSPDSTYRLSFLTDSAFLSDTLIAGYQKLVGNNNEEGGLYFYRKSTGSLLKRPISTPVNAFIALDASTFFVALGSTFEKAAASSTRGIMRSLDGGSTWSAMSDADFPSSLLVNSFAYDAQNDILYAVSDNTAVSGQTGNGTLYFLKNALSQKATNWAKTPGTFETADSGSDASFATVAIDSSTGNVYVSSQRKIWVSLDQATSWLLFYTGVTSENVVALVFDGLFSGGPGGLQGYTGEPPVCKGNQGTARSDINKKNNKKNVLATMVGAFSKTVAPGETVTLQQRRKGQLKTLTTGVSNAKGKVRFTVSTRATSFRLLGAEGQVFCDTKFKK